VKMMMQPCPFKRKRTVQALKNVAFLKKIKNSTLCIIILLKKDIYNVTKEFYFKLMLFSDLFYSSNILKKKKSVTVSSRKWTFLTQHHQSIVWQPFNPCFWRILEVYNSL